MKPFLFMSGAGLLLLSACGTEENNNTNETGEEGEAQAQSADSEEAAPIEVHTTIFALEDFINRIGQEHVDVENIIPPGVDAHTYEPPMRLMMNLSDADAFIYSGGGMEGFIDTAVEILEEEDVKMVEASEGIEFIDESSHSHSHSHDNEHSHDHSHEDNLDHDDHHHSHENNDNHNHSHEDNHDHAHNDEDHTHSHENDHNHDHSHEDNDHNHTHNAEDHSHNNNHSHSHDHHDEAYDHDNENHHSHGEDGHHHGPGDPHVFIDPIRSIELAENISEALIELKPENEGFFKENFAELKSDLEELDERFQGVAEKAEREELFTAHAGYTYWADRYGFEQVPVTGFSPLNEPSQQEMQELIETAEENNIEYIVFERNYSIPAAEMLVDEIGAERLYFDNMEALTEEQREEEKGYVELMKTNIETLEQALK